MVSAYNLSRKHNSSALPFLRMAALAVILTVESGCTFPQVSQPYPVFWNAKADIGPGFYVYSYNENSFREQVIHLERPEWIRPIQLGLDMVNRTGREVFVSGEAEYLEVNAKYELITVMPEGTKRESGRFGKSPGGRARHYFLLSTAPLEHELKPMGLYTISVLSGQIVVGGYAGAGYYDIEIEIPLKYYTMGATEPERLTLRRTMRIVWDAPPGAKPQEIAPAR